MNHFAVQQKLTQHCKATILQLNKNFVDYLSCARRCFRHLGTQVPGMFSLMSLHSSAMRQTINESCM